MNENKQQFPYLVHNTFLFFYMMQCMHVSIRSKNIEKKLIHYKSSAHTYLYIQDVTKVLKRSLILYVTKVNHISV